jgi:hypothetical protein
MVAKHTRRTIGVRPRPVSGAYNDCVVVGFAIRHGRIWLVDLVKRRLRKIGPGQR